MGSFMLLWPGCIYNTENDVAQANWVLLNPLPTLDNCDGTDMSLKRTNISYIKETRNKIN